MSGKIPWWLFGRGMEWLLKKDWKKGTGEKINMWNGENLIIKSVIKSYIFVFARQKIFRKVKHIYSPALSYTSRGLKMTGRTVDSLNSDTSRSSLSSIPGAASSGSTPSLHIYMIRDDIWAGLRIRIRPKKYESLFLIENFFFSKIFRCLNF